MAGGRVVGPDGTTITYGHHARFYRNGPFAALASRRGRDPPLADRQPVQAGIGVAVAVQAADEGDETVGGSRAQYCVNIGLIQGDRPIAAALAAPGLGRVWAAGTTARAP
jgi:hypothetical protein